MREFSANGIDDVWDSDQTERIADLERKIAMRTAGRIRDLKVESIGDAVILCGRTSTYYIKQLATQIALDEDGTLSLQNSIEVV